jgi:hypothetical protein
MVIENEPSEADSLLQSGRPEHDGTGAVLHHRLHDLAAGQIGPRAQRRICDLAARVATLSPCLRTQVRRRVAVYEWHKVAAVPVGRA